MRTSLFKFFSFFCCILVAACSSVDEKSSSVETPSQESLEFGTCVFSSNTPTEVSGKLHVYDAMARAAKYNSLKLANNMKNKVYSQNPNMTPQDVIDNVLNTPDEGGPIYNGVRVLDYALIYAGAYLSENQIQADELILQRSAQSLALAAIKTQGDIMIAEREIREINSLIKDEQKNLSALVSAYNSTGKLSAEEIEYKSGLETTLLRLPQIRESLVNEIVAYRQLVKNNREELELDGRKFYELDVFDARLTPEVYQRAALANRPEFQIPLARLSSLNFDKVVRYVNQTYDLDKSQELGGVGENSELYDEALQGRAAAAAKGLIDALVAYHAEVNKGENPRLRSKIFDELAAAVFVQIDLMYRVVQKADFDYQAVSKEIAAVTKDVNRLKNRSLAPLLKADLLNQKVKLITLKIKQNRIRAERTTALAALYFYAGYAPFGCSLLQSSVDEIAAVLKSGFNADRIRLLSMSLEQVENSKTLASSGKDKDIHWAQGDNWLEAVVEGENRSVKTRKKLDNTVSNPISLVPPLEPEKMSSERVSSGLSLEQNNSLKAEKKSILSVKSVMSDDILQPKGDFEPYTDKNANQFDYMQLGAYVDLENLEHDWARLSSAFPQLKNYQIIRQEAFIDGKNYTRLLLYSPKGGLMDLCNLLRKKHEQCFLK